MSQHNKPEPFGYFKAEPFGWTDCAETDEGAWPLYDQQAIDDLVRQRDELLAALINYQDQTRPIQQTIDAIARVKESK